MKHARPVIGLTGGIGSGKSAAAAHFESLGAAVVDTDAIAHGLTAPGGAAMPAIRAAFGEAVVAPNGALDRGAMRSLVFGDPGARARLEAILHPMIRSEAERQCGEAKTCYVMLVVPLLVESGSYRERVDRICVVDCPEDMQVERVTRRNGLDVAQVRAIMAAQASRVERLAAADDVVDNGGDLASLKLQVEKLHSIYCALAA